MATSNILRTNRLELRPFTAEFLTDRYVGWLNDKITVRYSEQRHRVHTLDSCRSYAQSFDHSPNYFWVIVAHDTSLGHIGNMTAMVDPINRVADLAIIIGEPEARGRLYGLEAWQRACRFLLTEAEMRKITAGTMATNVPMVRLMRASGMVEEGRRKRQLLAEGEEVDVVMAALFTE